MKIALVTQFFYPSTGGTQTVVAALADELGRRGHQVSVYAPCATAHGLAPSPTKAYGVAWIPSRQRPIAGYLAAQCRMWRRLRRRDVEVIHVFHPSFGPVALVVARLRSVRLVVSLMGRDVYEFRRMPRLKRRITLAVCRGADVVTAPSRDLARLARRTGVKRGIELIPHGVAPARADPRRVTSLRHSLGIDAGNTVFVAVQRLYRVKEPTVFIEAWRLLEPTDCRLILVGGGELECSLRRRVAELGLAGVSLVGEVPREDVPCYLGLADAFIHHSRYESFGLGVLEAMQAGLPVVASSVGAIPELVTDGVEGLLIPPSDPTAMANAVRRLAGSPRLRDRLAQAGRERAAQFRWDRIVERYEELYAV